LAAVAALAMALTAAPRAHAALLTGAGVKVAPSPDRSTVATEIRFGGGHGGRGGGGFRGGGFHGGGAAVHRGGGGGFRGAAPAFRGGAVHAAPVFRGGGVRAFSGGAYRFAAPLAARHHAYAPVRHHWRPRHHFGPRYYGYDGPRYVNYAHYYGPRRFCRIVWTYYGPRKICRYKPWRHHWRHHHRRHHWRVY
jgi:hypothetical protein